MLMIKLRGDSSDESSSINEHSSSFFNADRYQRNPFVCSRCKKAFPTTQALGGHQNAHRKERLEERLKKERDMPRPPAERQMIDFWANEQQDQQCFSTTGTMNHYQMITPHGVAVMMRDFMGVVTTEKQGGYWLEKFPADADSGTYGGGDYGPHRELTSKNELDLALKL